MVRALTVVSLSLLLGMSALRGDDEPVAVADARADVYVIPVTEAIGNPNLFIVRRGVKEAIRNEVDLIVLDMDTPGGSVKITLELMEMLDRFGGSTATYVNDEAISAGALIAASTDAIYFAPNGKIGAAAVVFGTGEDVPETMRLKLNSYMNAVIRAMNEEDPYRGQVIRAMMEEDFVLEIEGEVIKPEGELLTLTASEAMREFGDPPRPLLGAGIHDDVESLLDARYGAGNYTIRDFQITYSEKFAKWMSKIAPVLLGIGMLMLFVEFKTPSFGVIGGIGIGLIVVFFLSNYVAGLAGREVIVLFALGVLLVLAEIVFMPGSFLLFAPGALLILAALVWAMVDVWPQDGGGIALDEAFRASLVDALTTLVYGMTIAIAGMVLLWRYLPKSWLLDRIVHQGASAAADPVNAGGGSSAGGSTELPEIGSSGVVVKPLHPVGEVEIGGHRFQAAVATGSLERGEAVVVRGHRNFALLVERGNLS